MEALLLPSPPSPNMLGFEEDGKESSLLLGICVCSDTPNLLFYLYCLKMGGENIYVCTHMCISYVFGNLNFRYLFFRAVFWYILPRPQPDRYTLIAHGKSGDSG